MLNERFPAHMNHKDAISLDKLKRIEFTTNLNNCKPSIYTLHLIRHISRVLSSSNSRPSLVRAIKLLASGKYFMEQFNLSKPH